MAKENAKGFENLTIGEAKAKLEEYKQLSELFGKNIDVKSDVHPFVVGKNYFIRTVTMAYTGKLIQVYPDCLVLDDASWIADTGRFSDFLNTGVASEVEPFPKEVIVPRGSIVDISLFEHDLPRVKK